MNRSFRTLALGCAFASVLALGGCWDSDDDVPPPTASDQVPPSASESIDGFIAYLKTLVVVSDDTLQPVDISAVTPPGDETSEPAPID